VSLKARVSESTAVGGGAGGQGRGEIKEFPDGVFRSRVSRSHNVYIRIPIVLRKIIFHTLCAL